MAIHLTVVEMFLSGLKVLTQVELHECRRYSLRLSSFRLHEAALSDR